MLLHTFLGLTLTVVVGFGAAQGTTVSLFLPNTDPQSLVASVIGTVRTPMQCLPLAFASTPLS